MGHPKHPNLGDESIGVKQSSTHSKILPRHADCLLGVKDQGAWTRRFKQNPEQTICLEPAVWMILVGTHQKQTVTASRPFSTLRVHRLLASWQMEPKGWLKLLAEFSDLIR